MRTEYMMSFGIEEVGENVNLAKLLEDLLTKGKVALTQFVAYDDRDFKDFCKEEGLDYNDPNALQEYVETYDDAALIEMLNDDEQGRYYELKEAVSE